MNTYIRDICLTAVGKELPVDLDSAPKLGLGIKDLSFIKPDFKTENVINVTYDFEYGTPQYFENLERLKKFHCDLNPKLPFSALGYLKDIPVPVHENLQLDINFQYVDFSQLQELYGKEEKSVTEEETTDTDLRHSRRIDRLRRRQSSVHEVDSGDGSRRRRLRQRRHGMEETGQDITALQGSTRLEAKRRRRQESHLTTLRQTKITESEFLARRECVDRKMVVREKRWFEPDCCFRRRITS